MWHVHAPPFNKWHKRKKAKKKKNKKVTLHILTHGTMRRCGLTSLVVCIDDKIRDIRERNVTRRSEIWPTNIGSLGFQDIREWVTLWGLIVQSLGCIWFNPSILARPPWCLCKLRATSYTSQEPWPWNCESPKESAQRPSQDTSRLFVVWSRILTCSVKPYVTGHSTNCYFNEFMFMRILTHEKNIITRRLWAFGMPWSPRFVLGLPPRVKFLKIVQVTMKHDPLDAV